jgi:uncharacterized protein
MDIVDFPKGVTSERQHLTTAATRLFLIFGLLCTISLMSAGWTACAGERIPPVPTHYFNDYAQVVSAATSARLDKTLEDFERETSNQILVAIYSKMQSDSSIEDYTVRVAQAWRVGQKVRNNGAVLFVFITDRKMFLQVGYGLEGALPDVVAKRIIEDEIKPRFKNGDFGGGLTAGVAAILAATKGEYKGTGATVGGQGHGLPAGFVVLIFVTVLIAVLLMAARRGGYAASGWTLGSGGFSSGSWGGGGGGGGGGFSAGGGSFGGGGAGGSW